MTTSLATTERTSKGAKEKENIYNSKTSIEESFAIDESMKSAPNKILAITDSTVSPDN